jgi:ParB family chromosome partitioning protein
MAFLFVENLTGEDVLTDEIDGEEESVLPDGGYGEVRALPIARILPNPAQPRRHFEREALLSLSESIRRHGILQPPVVRPLGGGHYELIAGERRLRAASLAGLEEIPCLVRESKEEESAALAILENLQRKDLDMFEEAAALSALAERYGLTQAEIGAKLSVSQSYVANKLRLLRLSEGAKEILREGNLTERHARAVLRLPEEERMEALAYMAKGSLNVAAAEAYVERRLSEKEASEQKEGKRARGRGIIKDIRLFYNSLDRAVNLVKEAGIGVISERTERDDCIELRIRIEKPRG